MDEFLQDFYNAGFLDSYVNKATLMTMGVAGILLTLFIPIALGWNFIVVFWRNGFKQPDLFKWDEIGRVMVLCALLALYIPIFGSVALLANAINKGTVPSSALISQNIDLFEQHLNKQIAPPGTVGNTDTPDPDPNVPVTPLPQNENVDTNFSWTDFLSNPFNVIIAILQGVVIVILTVVGIIIKLCAQVLAKILYALGPLAIVFSLLPNFKDRLGSWFSSYINLLLVGTTCNVIDIIVYGSFFGAAQGDVISDKPLSILLIDVVIIVVYLFAFWLTSKYVGSNDAGKVLTQGLQTASAAVGNWAGARAGVTKAADGAASAGKKGFESMADTGKNAMNQ